MSHKPKPSGAEFRKKREEKEEREDQLIKKIPKITSFFTRADDNPTSASLSTSTSASEENPALEDNSISVEPEAVELEEGNVSTIVNFDSDPALWNVDENLRDYVCINGVSQNSNQDFLKSKRQYPDKSRCLSKSLFQKRLKNGETKNRSWLVYSPSTGCVFCVPCMLFGDPDGKGTFSTGFNDWKNASRRVDDHENSAYHRSSLTKLKLRSSAKGSVNVHLIEELEHEIQYWREVLKRVVAAVKYLTFQGLALRGTNEHLGRFDRGNFFGLLEFLAEFDPFMAEHLTKYGDKGSGSTSYLSKTTYNEFISLMAEKIKSTILKEVRQAKYFGIVLDSTPDISHVDQLTFVVRYVNKDGVPVERFICFVPHVGHKAQQIVSTVLELFNKFDLDISNCRGQAYDNASNMSGVYSGVQARIKELNPLAEYVPCAAHSLNLVGSCAAESCTEAVSFFGLLQEIYNFFSASTHRWAILKEHCSLQLQNLSKTRWSARHDACRVVNENLEGIVCSLQKISNDREEKPSTRNEAKSLKEKLSSLETTIMAILWGKIFERFNKVNKKLQYQTTDLGKIITYYNSLCGFFLEIRDNFDELESTAKGKCGEEYRVDTHRKRKRSKHAGEYGETSSEISLSGSDNFRVNSVNVILDSLHSEVKRRGEKYNELHKRFGFLEVLQGLTPSEITKQATELLSVYCEDLEPALVDECLHLKPFLTQNTDQSKTCISLTEIIKLLHHFDAIDIYPNIEIALRIVLCAPATNCTGERSFSALRRVKNYLRSTMSHDQLSSLALLNIEGRLTQELQYDDIIDTFARQKARRKAL